MWFVDIVVDLGWFINCKGNLGSPNSRSRQIIPGRDFDNEFLLYGDEQAIRHLRILLHSDTTVPPHEIVDENIARWVDLLEVASGLAAPSTASVARLGLDNPQFIVLLGQGDERTASAILDLEFAPPASVDYRGVAGLMAGWKPDFRNHMFYLSRFLNKQLPPEFRWLNGYRLMEWHFLRGRSGLARNAAYRDFLASHGAALDTLLAPNQDRKGIIEEVRALAAHAIVSRASDPRNENGSTNLVLKSFSALEKLIIALIGDGVIDGISFWPKPQKHRDKSTNAQSAAR